MKKSITIMALIVSLAIATVASATITPTVLLNGNHYNQMWRPDYAAPTVEIKMVTDETAPADWWLVCLTPNGWKYFSSAGWASGFAVTYQGNLFPFGQAAIPTAGLDLSQPGTFTFYFGVDKKVEGLITSDSLAYDALSLNVIPTGKQAVVTLFDTFQTIGFDLTSGNINGFVVDGVARPIAVAEIESVMEVSDRVGWTGNSVAITAFNPSGVVWIPSTANSDKAQWVLKLTSGKFAWANLDEIAFAGKTFVRTADDLIQYGSYRKQTIYFANGQSYIDFGCNLTDGMVSHVNPSDISYVRWNSDATGWNTSVSVWSVLQMDISGNYFVAMTGMPKSDTGLFSVVLKNGSVVWLNIDSWAYSGASISGGLIKY